MSRIPARIQIAVCVFACALLAGCATSGNRPLPTTKMPAGESTSAPGPVRSSNAGAGRTLSPAERAAAIASAQVGVPYRYGGASQSGFDCSGLVHFAYRKAGVATPRTTKTLWRELEPVAAARLEVGDILFFDIAGKVSHVGLYLGHGRFVHAPSTGRTVTVARLDDPFYRQAFIRGGRP